MARRVVVVLALVATAVALVHVERAPERPLALQPGPDADEYASAGSSLANDKGFYTYVHHGARQPPRYPPGYPMALAPFATVGSYPRNVQRGAKFWALAYVAAVVLAAWWLGGALAAVLAAFIVAVSPFAHDAAGLVLSDAFIATLTVLMLPCLKPPTRAGARFAGAASGLATITRLTAAVNFVGLLAALPRRHWKRMLLWGAPSLLLLGALQWMLFGSPFESGYSYWGVSGHFFSLGYLTGNDVIREGPFIFPDRLGGDLLQFTCPCQVGGPQNSLPNLTFYPLLLTGGFWVFAPPFLPLLGLYYAWRQRSAPVGRYALVILALTLVIFYFYRYQGTRFVAGPATVLVVLACVQIAEFAGRFVPKLAPQRLTSARQG